MAEGFEPYHVPQQSRRDKLRVVALNNPELQPCSSLLPLNYDPTSLLSSDLLASCPNSLVVTEACNNKQNTNHHHHNSVKEEAGASGTLMGFFGGVVNVSSSSSSSQHHHQHVYLDPQSSLHINPSSTSIHNTNNQNSNNNNNNNPFLYSALQGLRGFEHSYNHGGGGSSGDVVGFKHEPLSLSLSSHHTHQSNNLPLELNLQRYGSTIYRDMIPAGIVGATAGSTSNEVTRCSVPLGPFTGYASILKGSRFLRPAQQLLEEFCDVGRGIYGDKVCVDAAPLMEPPIECLNASGIGDDSSSSDGGETRRKKSRLISMLDEVYRRYKHYYQQMQAVVESFECVAGLGNAAPYANLALKAMSKHFRSLKNAITDQLQFTNKAHGQLSHGKEEATRFGSSDKGVYSRSIQNSGYIDHNPVWRPQRGLPERAVTVLRAWLFEHFLHPYPTDTDKMMLAKQTGLSRSQVSNWFINARVRLWKPMVEEIHTLETRQAQKAAQKEERNANRNSDPAAPSSSVVMDNPSTSNQRSQDAPSKRTRNDLPELPGGSEAPLNLSYNSLSSQQHVGVGIGMGVGSTGVSLTLGLQNNAMGISEPFPISAAQRFGLGLEANGQGFVMGGFEAQNRHFGRDVMGGQLLHDFVG